MGICQMRASLFVAEVTGTFFVMVWPVFEGVLYIDLCLQEMKRECENCVQQTGVVRFTIGSVCGVTWRRSVLVRNTL